MRSFLPQVFVEPVKRVCIMGGNALTVIYLEYTSFISKNGRQGFVRWHSNLGLLRHRVVLRNRNCCFVFSVLWRIHVTSTVMKLVQITVEQRQILLQTCVYFSYLSNHTKSKPQSHAFSISFWFFFDVR